jgi:hypothetical protein
MRPQAGVGKLKPVPPMHANDLPVVGQALSPANCIISHLLSERGSDQSPERQKVRKNAPRAGVDRLKPVPPMHANDLPVVEQTVSSVNPSITAIFSQLLSERVFR